MNIGIVTQPLGDNYGGLLQNWALQQVLVKLGHSPITLDAYSRLPLSTYLVKLAATATLKCLGRKQMSWPYKPQKGKRYHCSDITTDFIRNSIKTTEPFYYYNSQLIKDYDLDAVVVGSDQVWRPIFNPRIADMFLDFAKKHDIKKVAYAASFGTDQWEFSPEQTLVCKKLVQEFKAVSVRENSGIQLCQKHLDVNCRLVLDSTLLLTSDDYSKLITDVPVNAEEFIAVYCLDKTEDKVSIFDSISEKYNLPLHVFSAHDNISLSVEKWLAVFRDAKVVITDSFHGTVFSILFHKPFYTILNPHRGNERFTSLLSSLHLDNRIIETKEAVKHPATEINWDEIDDQLNLHKSESLKFLDDALNS